MNGKIYVKPYLSGVVRIKLKIEMISMVSKVKSTVPLFVALTIVWLGLSVLVGYLASLNENKRKMRAHDEGIVQSSEVRNDSLWKEYVLGNLADIQKKEKVCAGKLDSLIMEVSQAVVELRRINRTLKIRKSK